MDEAMRAKLGADALTLLQLTNGTLRSAIDTLNVLGRSNPDLVVAKEHIADVIEGLKSSGG